MNRRFRDGAVILTACVLFLGCSQATPPGGPRVKTYPVSGFVHVDGKPKQGVAIKFSPQEGSSAIKFQVMANTGSDGKFSASTYSSGDGLPEGTYKLTFELDNSDTSAALPTTMRTKDDEGSKDQLHGAYSDPVASKFEVTISKDKKNDLGVFELSTSSSS